MCLQSIQLFIVEYGKRIKGQTSIVTLLTLSIIPDSTVINSWSNLFHLFPTCSVLSYVVLKHVHRYFIMYL